MGQSDIVKEGGDEIDGKRLGGKYSVGGLMWLKLSDGLWWPGKIVGRRNVSKDSKLRNKADGDVRVRLYGSYEYLYIDPVKSTAEFETILKLNNSDYRQIFEESLKQSIASSRRDGLKGQETHRESRKIRGSKQQEKHKEINPSSPGTDRIPDHKGMQQSPRLLSTNTENVLSGNSPQSSARKIRVMRRLALTAPAGSPFGKSRQCN